MVYDAMMNTTPQTGTAEMAERAPIGYIHEVVSTFDLCLHDDDITEQNLRFMGTLEAAFDHPKNVLPPEYFFFADHIPVGSTVRVTLELVRPNA